MDPAKMKVVDLRQELGALGLDTKGNKPALVERLKKALESKSGKPLADTTILDTSTEDADEPATPAKKVAPAQRTTRRSSSSRLGGTPAKQMREDPPSPIEEESKSPQRVDSSSDSPPSPPESQQESPQPAPQPQPEPRDTSDQPAADQQLYDIDQQSSGDEKQQEESRDEDEVKRCDGGGGDGDGDGDGEGHDSNEEKPEKMDQGEDENGDNAEKRNEKHEMTEEEEWDELNERLKIREQERLERERKQAEDDAKKFEELSNDPVKLNRLKRKREKKARWSNFYRSVEVTNQVLTPPTEFKDRAKKEVAEAKVEEPELNDNRITLSWYDSDLNQYLELPELNSVVPMNEGAFYYAWAGARASHGVTRGRLCYEVRVGAALTATETPEKETVGSALRIGWSTDDSSLHLGEGELSWGFETSGRAVNNGEFKEYGQQLNEKDVIGAYLDLESSPAKISYTVNGVQLGTAYEIDKEALNGKALFPHLLTKNMCYKVNFGYDRYNMLTRTKIVRNRIEVPVEQILEEKRIREEEIKRQKEEAIKKAKEKREKEKKEREERQRKKREEREKAEKERKEKEAEERRERGEEAPEQEQKDQEMEQDKDKEKETQDDAQPQQDTNGEEQAEKPTESEAQPEVKEEPMDQDTEPAEEAKPDQEVTPDQDVKQESANEGPVPVVTEEQFLKGHVLDKRIKFVIRYTVDEELDGAEACLEPGFLLICQGDLEEGARRPPTLADCEVILMVGMPGAGKTYWAKKHVAENPDKRYNIISTGALFDKMKVDCKPFRSSYEGRWDAMVSKCAKCVLKLLETAKGRRRNYILDQTNVYPSAQRRKLREFAGYRRVAVALVTDIDTYKERQKRREDADGKEVPDGAIMDMKANFTLPEKCPWIDEVIYPELDEEESKKIVAEFHKEAKAAGVVREREKRDRSENRDGPPNKRARSDDRKRRDDRRRDFGRDREDRWGGGGGGSRWGPATRGGGGGGGGGGAGAGGRWGPQRNERHGGGGGRSDRWGPPNREFGGGSRDRDGFRGGRGGGGGGGGPRDRSGGPPGGPGGPARDRPAPGGPRANDRFGNRGPDRSRPPGAGMGPGGPAGGPPDRGSGSWQRGGQMAQNSRGGGGGMQRGSQPNARNGKDAANSQQNPQQGWNQWAGGWGGWGNWNQNQAANWNQQWNNWNQWNQSQGQAGGAGAGSGGGAAGGAGGQGKWGQYTPQQWYQWQQWQQQAQAWPQYQQGQQGGQQADANAWAQYYQNYGANAAGAAASNTAVEKK